MEFLKVHQLFIQHDAIASLLFLSLVYLAYNAVRITHRLYFSPLAKFPGPKLAAATYLYEEYYDIWLGGQYTNKIKQMHQQCGPIIRIGPEELHVSDPSFIAPLYTPSPHPSMQNKTPKRYRWTRQVYSTGFGEASVVSTTDHDLHRLRRKPLEPFFTVAQMRKIQGLIYDKADLLCKRMKEAAADEEPVKIKLAYSCYTTDVISMYLLGVCFDFLDHPGFNREFSDTVTQLAKATPILRPFWWLTSVMEYVPPALRRYLGPGIRAVLAQREETKHHLAHAKARKLAKEKSATPPTETTSPTDSPTVIDALLTSSLPPSEKSDFRLRMEIEILLAAGTETTATCLGALTVFVLDDPDVHAKLTKELVDAIPDASKLPPLQVLERLPYLTGVIREGLRLGFGIYTRITRMAEEPLPYGPYAIPPLTPVSMTSGLTHVDPAIWDQPTRFMPERWADPAEAARLGRYLTAFSKGGRACLGINLAYAEMYVAVAAVFRRFGRMELCGFGKEDVEEVVADWNLPKFGKTLNELSVYIK